MKNYFWGLLLILLYLSCCKARTPCEEASELSGLSLCAPVKMDSLADDRAPNGDFSFYAVCSFPDSEIPKLHKEAEARHYKRSVEAMPLSMNRYWKDTDEIYFFHSQEEHAAGDTYVLLNFTSRKLVMYAVRI